MIEHGFTPIITKLLKKSFGDKAKQVFSGSPLLQYLNIKTRSASKGSKSRSSFANNYVIYVLVEHYLTNKFDRSGDYGRSEGARFSDLLLRAKGLPFGSKLQNHAFNSRMNDEFKKFFPTCEFQPILRNLSSRRYWINENLLRVRVGRDTFNLARVIIKILDAYIDAKRNAFESFITTCKRLRGIEKADSMEGVTFVSELLEPNVDARVFEIVSFAILKQFYADQSIHWGWTVDRLTEARLILYKTGRTNANDGGIDFVMRPLGRFFQVTETTDVRKYLLDIDKVQRYPITFVVKSTSSVEDLRDAIRQHAERVYSVKKIVERYMECVEEVINIPILLERFRDVVKDGGLAHVIDELVLQSQVEFNYEDA
ncbi:MAG TPA: hypothetical protein VND64_18525 [Pirellulales bacterium]|nr:hypothetical protein [Pirellulales bacterium]